MSVILLFSNGPNDLLHACPVHIKTLQTFLILQNGGPDVAHY